MLPEIDKEGTVSETLKVGQEILVQISKEPISSKGPRLTAEISFLFQIRPAEKTHDRYEQLSLYNDSKRASEINGAQEKGRCGYAC